jgi:hypothetical protein
MPMHGMKKKKAMANGGAMMKKKKGMARGGAKIKMTQKVELLDVDNAVSH